MSVQLNVPKILLGAFVFPWHYRNAFFKALIIPILCLVVFEQLMSQIDQHASLRYGTLVVLQLSVLTLFSVTCHRLVLIDPKLVSSAPLRFGRRELRFLCWIITISLVFLVFAMPLMLLVFVFVGGSNKPNHFLVLVWSLIVLTPLLYVVARLSVIFPAIATDREFGFKWAWALTKNHGLHLVAIVVGLPIILALILNPLYRDQASLVETIILSFISAALAAVEVVAISLAYRELVESSP